MCATANRWSYEDHVRAKFPLPDDVRELVHGEPLECSTVLFDRGYGSSVVFREWGIDSEIMVVESGAITVRANFCWYGIHKGDTMKRERLVCYAPGNGSLDLVWLRDGVATGRQSTMADARRYMKTKDGKFLDSHGGWRPMFLNGLPTLVAYVERVGPNQVKTFLPRTKDEVPEMGVFSYQIMPDQDDWLARKMMNCEGISVTCLHDGRVVDVLNWSLKSKIAHFLNFESEILAWDEAERSRRVFSAVS